MEDSGIETHLGYQILINTSMKIDEILSESMTFNGCQHEERDGRITIVPMGGQSESDCQDCEGSGLNWQVEDYPEHFENGEDKSCMFCKGTGKVVGYNSNGPELNVSEVNGFEIQRMLGMEPDYMGEIEKSQFPDIRRKLIKIINSDKDRESHTKQGSTEQGGMRISKGDGGVSKIGRGPTMIDGGRTETQVMRYAKSLLEIMEYVEANGGDCLSWG